jgi:hypothetical protein
MRLCALVVWVGLLGGAAIVVAGETVSITLPDESIALRPGPGMEKTQADCRMCHSLDYISSQPPGGIVQWQGVVTKMIKVYGAPIGDEDAKTIVDYLSRHYGPR